MASDKAPAPMPSESADFVLQGIPEFEQVGRDAGCKLMALAHVKGAVMSEDTESARPPVCISAVVDRSGSMRGEKLQLVKRTLSFVVRELTAKDLFGIIAYDNTVSQALALTKMDAAGKRKAEAAIAAIQDGGSTNLSGGLLAGVDQMVGRPFVDTTHFGGAARRIDSAPLMRQRMQQAPSGGIGSSLRNMVASMSCMPRRSMVASSTSSRADMAGPSSVPVLPPAEVVPEVILPQGTVCATWLFTDGMANAGITDSAGIVSAMQARMVGMRSASVFTFGYGQSHNADMLRAIAEAASGMYYFIESPDSIPGAFGECLGGVLSVVAQGLTVQVRAAPGVKLLRVLGQQDVKQDGTSSANLTLRDLYAEEERDMLVELEVSPEAGECLARLELCFTDARTSRRREIVGEITVGRPAKVDGEQESNPQVDEQRNRVATAEALSVARELAEAGRYEQAREALTTARRHVDCSKTGQTQFNRDLADDLEANCDAMMSASVYQSRGSKLSAQTAMCHSKQRSCAISGGVGAVSKERYTNSRQKVMKDKFGK